MSIVIFYVVSKQLKSVETEYELLKFKLDSLYNAKQNLNNNLSDSLNKNDTLKILILYINYGFFKYHELKK